jgi:hypothetical protein
MARDLGTPAATVAELATAPEAARRSADEELARMHGVAVEAADVPDSPGPLPPVDRAAGGRVTQDGGCVAFAPASAGPAEPQPALELTLPAGGVVISADRGPATISIRRFADGFSERPLGRIAAGRSGRLAIRADRAAQPWHVRVVPEARATACAM